MLGYYVITNCYLRYKTLHRGLKEPLSAAISLFFTPSPRTIYISLNKVTNNFTLFKNFNLI
jgi:hypothetical protein